MNGIVHKPRESLNRKVRTKLSRRRRATSNWPLPTGRRTVTSREGDGRLRLVVGCSQSVVKQHGGLRDQGEPQEAGGRQLRGVDSRGILRSPRFTASRVPSGSMSEMQNGMPKVLSASRNPPKALVLRRRKCRSSAIKRSSIKHGEHVTSKRSMDPMRSNTVAVVHERILKLQFERFWPLYPRKVSKVDAQKAWLKMMRTQQDVDTCLTNTLLWARTFTDPQFIPYPATYLRRGQWQDPPPALNGHAVPQRSYSDLVED